MLRRKNQDRRPFPISGWQCAVRWANPESWRSCAAGTYQDQTWEFLLSSSLPGDIFMAGFFGGKRRDFQAAFFEEYAVMFVFEEVFEITYGDLHAGVTFLQDLYPAGDASFRQTGFELHQIFRGDVQVGAEVLQTFAQ